MTTQNKAVTCYLPKDIEDFITGYCNEYGITRKDKEGSIYPSLGTGIIELLKQLAYNPELVGRPLPDTVPSTISEAAIEKKIGDILEKKLSHLPNNVPSIEVLKDQLDPPSPPSPVKETISKDNDSRLTDLESSVQAFIQIVKNHDSQLTNLFNETIEYGDEIKKVNDRIQAVEIAIDCQHYGDEVKELRGQVDELRKLVYQLTSPVKKR